MTLAFLSDFTAVYYTVLLCRVLAGWEVRFRV